MNRASLYDDIRDKEMNLGLDLQGGLHLLMDVDVDSVFKQQVENLKSSVRITLRQARARSSGISIKGDSVNFKLLDPGKIEVVQKKLRDEIGDLDYEVDEAGYFTIFYSPKFLAEQKDGYTRSVDTTSRRKAYPGASSRRRCLTQG